MAINHRRGKIGDFDPNKMTTAEWAFPDDGTARYCVAPGNVKTVATKEELQEILTSSPEAYQALLQLIGELEDNPSELTNILNNIVDLQANKIDTDAIANNLVTTEAGLVLDARQGKVLDGKVNELTNNLAVQQLNFTANPTYGSIALNSSFRIGNVAYINIVVSLTTTVPSAATILTMIDPYSAAKRADMKAVALMADGGLKGLVLMDVNKNIITANGPVTVSGVTSVFITGIILLK